MTNDYDESIQLLMLLSSLESLKAYNKSDVADADADADGDAASDLYNYDDHDDYHLYF